MKKAIVLLCCGALAPVAFGDYVERARVVESSPIVETVVEAEEVCRYRNKRRGGSGNAEDAGNIERKVIGGVVGGLAGSAVGKGSGRDAAAGIGAVIGSEVGDGDGISEGELIGGIAGGIIGNQIGKGSGKTAGTAAGALLGAIIGDELQNGGARENDVANADDGEVAKVLVCTMEEREKKVITGYDVVFEYNGLRSSGRLPYRPADYVDINVRLDLLENRTGFSAE